MLHLGRWKEMEGEGGEDVRGGGEKMRGEEVRGGERKGRGGRRSAGERRERERSGEVRMR